MLVSERIVRKTLEKFSDALQTCADRKYNKGQVIRFFGKPRAARWCGSWNGYPDLPIVLWYEKRYKKKFKWPLEGRYFDKWRYYKIYRY